MYWILINSIRLESRPGLRPTAHEAINLKRRIHDYADAVFAVDQDSICERPMEWMSCCAPTTLPSRS